MTVLERIKEECRLKKNISVTTLEQELGYSNGSLAKAKDIPSSRICEIANYLGISMDYLMTVENPEIQEFEPEHLELIELYSSLKKEQKSAVINLLRSFAL